MLATACPFPPLNLEHALPRLPAGRPDSTTAEVEFYLDGYFNKTDLLGHIATVRLQGGQTNTALGLQTLRESVFIEAEGFRGDNAIIIVVTDGFATDSGLLAAQSALLVDMVCVLCPLTAPPGTELQAFSDPSY